MEGFNVFGGSCDVKARIGIIANNEIGCGSCPDSTIGFGISGDLAVSNSKCSNVAAYGQDADNGGRDLKAMGYILVQWHSKSFYTWRLCPKVQPLTILCTIFSRKRYPVRIPSIEKWYPFHLPCLKLCISFNCCKCTVI